MRKTLLITGTILIVILLTLSACESEPIHAPSPVLAPTDAPAKTPTPAPTPESATTPEKEPPAPKQSQKPHWAFASMNPNDQEDDIISNGAMGVAFWAYRTQGKDEFIHEGSLHSFHVNLALQKTEGANNEPSFHYGFLVRPSEPEAMSPSISGGLSDGTSAPGSTTRWDIKIPCGDINSRSWYVVLQNGQDKSGNWMWDYWLYIKPKKTWHHVTTVYMDSGYIGRSPNMNAEIAAGGGLTACDDRFIPVTFHRVHVLKNGTWQNIPHLIVGYTPDESPWEDCPVMDWDIIDSLWATVSSKGRDTLRDTEWNGNGLPIEIPDIPSAVPTKKSAS